MSPWSMLGFIGGGLAAAVGLVVAVYFIATPRDLTTSAPPTESVAIVREVTPGPPKATGRAGTWALWSVEETWDQAHNSFRTKASKLVAEEVERDLDRGACELVSQRHVGKFHDYLNVFPVGSSKSTDGGHYRFGMRDLTGGGVTSKHFSCVASGKPVEIRDWEALNRPPASATR